VTPHPKVESDMLVDLGSGAMLSMIRTTISKVLVVTTPAVLESQDRDRDSTMGDFLRVLISEGECIRLKLFIVWGQ
jgi:hypothetical protein